MWDFRTQTLVKFTKSSSSVFLAHKLYPVKLRHPHAESLAQVGGWCRLWLIRNRRLSIGPDRQSWWQNQHQSISLASWPQKGYCCRPQPPFSLLIISLPVRRDEFLCFNFLWNGKNVGIQLNNNFDWQRDNSDGSKIESAKVNGSFLNFMDYFCDHFRNVKSDKYRKSTFEKR